MQVIDSMSCRSCEDLDILDTILKAAHQMSCTSSYECDRLGDADTNEASQDSRLCNAETSGSGTRCSGAGRI
jgi:hypothetical protein